MIIKDTGEIMFARTKFNYDRDAASLATALHCKQEGEDGYDGKTQQNFKEETDINTIVNNFLHTGQMPDNVRLPQYIDYEGVFDFQTAMNSVMAAEESFMQIPADIRAKFDNNPQKFHDFAINEQNRDELGKMGFLRPKPVTEAPPPPPPAPAPAAGTSTTT